MKFDDLSNNTTNWKKKNNGDHIETKVNYLICQDDPLFEMGKHLLVISDEVGVRHEGQFLAVLRSQLYWGGNHVCYQVVHERCSTGARITKPHHLQLQMYVHKFKCKSLRMIQYKIFQLETNNLF